MKPLHTAPRRFYPALVLMTFKTIEDIAPRFPTRGDFLAFAEQIRSGVPAPLNIGATTEADEVCIGVTLADGRIASAVTRAAWMRKREEDAQDLRAGTIDQIEERIRANVVVPDVAYLLETPPTLAAMRIERRDGAANHFENLDDLVQIDQLFHQIAAHDDRIEKIDGSLSEEAVFRALLEHFVKGPLKEKRCAKTYGCDDPIHCTPRLTHTCPWWELHVRLAPLWATRV